MNALLWRGARPPRSLMQRLGGAGWTMSDSAPRACVLRSSGQPPSQAAEGLPWIWLLDGKVSARAAADAAAQGALDVISTHEASWADRLLRRLAECTLEEKVPTPPPEFVAGSPASRALLLRISQAAGTSMPVLLTGETGTGKELAARLIHRWSRRQAGPFVPINCAAIPNELMEGELFGYAKGAFSGAVRGYEGLMSAAEQGTVLLDEIHDTPRALQTKLLRVLEDRVVWRLGESTGRQVDFRLLAATNQDLRSLVEQGLFGEDLYERLATVLIELPPLRARREDLPALVRALIERYYALEEERAQRPRVREVTPEAMEILQGHSWPGNIRELRNVIFGALVTKRSGDELLVSDLPLRLWKRDGPANTGVVSALEVERRIALGTMNLREEVERLERMALKAALARSGGNAAEAARLLGGVGRGRAQDPGGTVRTMMKRLGVRAPRLPRSRRPPEARARQRGP